MVEALVERHQRDELDVADWLAGAVVLADRELFGSALRICSERLDGAKLPAVALRWVADWTVWSGLGSDALLSFVRSFPFEGKCVEVIALLRHVVKLGHYDLLSALLKIDCGLSSDRFGRALRRTALDYDNIAEFARIPVIGEALAEVKRVQLIRMVSTLLGMDPLDAVDAMPRAIRLVPFSPRAVEEWTALKAAKGRR